jgi:hypothetical protein
MLGTSILGVQKKAPFTWPSAGRQEARWTRTSRTCWELLVVGVPSIICVLISFPGYHVSDLAGTTG